tara:strand:- start:3185 stop:4651 length:1467 start_codon:yes stop_codon:yes gene_type:complete
MQMVEDALAQGTRSEEIGFMSFTKKAVEEARSRACAKFNLEPKQLPWFRTLHSAAWRSLGLSRNDLLSMEDWRTLGQMLGLSFKGADSASPDEGILISAVGGDGSKYLQMIDRSRYRQCTLEQEFNDVEDYNLYFSKMKQIYETVVAYKSDNQKVDFADMIELALDVDPPRLQLLFIDEAQDLTPLQWEMVEHWTSNAERVVYAGDDDQAIHRWTGVDVKRFMNVTTNVEILSQSYRLPKRVFDVSQQIVQNIQTRFEKEFYPTEYQGVVEYHLTMDSVPIHQGSWTIMCRTNSFVREFADILRESGYLYSIKGTPSIKTEVGRAIQTWRELQADDMVSVDRIKKMYEVVPKQGDYKVVKRGAGNLLDAADPTGDLNIDDLYKHYGLECDRERNAMDVVRLGNDDKMYVQAIERRGESITEEPRIKLSTFHAMKGGEDDNCLVFLASTRACMESKYPDDEHRAFYVGVTRARKELHILDTDKKYRYEI